MPQQDTLTQSKELQKDRAFTTKQADHIAIAMFRATEHLPNKMQMNARFSSLQQNIDHLGQNVSNLKRDIKDLEQDTKDIPTLAQNVSDLKRNIKDLERDIKDIPKRLLMPITILVVLASAIGLFT